MALSYKSALSQKQQPVRIVFQVSQSSQNSQSSQSSRQKTTTQTDEYCDRDEIRIKKPTGNQAGIIISARRDFNMSQDDFARYVGVSKKDIADCEAGRITIPQISWQKIDTAIPRIRKEKAVEQQRAREAAKKYTEMQKLQKS